MRLAVGAVWVLVSACSGTSAKPGNEATNLQLPQIYPPVRAATPAALILDSEYAEQGAAVLLEDSGAASDAGLVSSVDAQSAPPDAALTSSDAGGPVPDAAVLSPLTDGGEFTPVDAGIAPPVGDASPGAWSDAAVIPPGGSVPPPGGGSAPIPPGGGSSPVPPGGGSAPLPPGGGGTAPLPPGGSGTSPMPPGGGPMMPGAINLATAIQERFYSEGPTALLRIVRDLDNRVATLETDPAKHPCLTEEPALSSYALPGGQTFDVRLQCLQRSGSTWIAFGFGRAALADAGPVSAADGNDFYLVTGQESGMGGAYRVEGKTGNVEGWITVADENVPNNSQVILHLLTNKQSGTLELALAGSGVGFCAAHLKTNADFLWVSGKTNGAAPPGSASRPTCTS